MFNTLMGRFGGFAGGGGGGGSVQILSDPHNSNMRTVDVDGKWNLNPSGVGGGGQGVTFVGNELIFKGIGPGSALPSADSRSGALGTIIVFKALESIPVSIEMWGGGGSYAGSHSITPPTTPGNGMGGGGGYIKGNLTIQEGSYYKLRVGAFSDYSGIFLTTADTDTLNVERSKDTIIAVAGGGGTAGAAGPASRSPPDGGNGGGAGFPTGGTGGTGYETNPTTNRPATGGSQVAGGTSAPHTPYTTYDGQFLGGVNIGGGGSTYSQGGAGGYYSGGHNARDPQGGYPGPGGWPGSGGGSNHSNSSFGNWVIVTNQGGQPTTARNVMPSDDYRYRSFSPGDPGPGSQWLDSYGGWSGGSPFSPAPSSNWTLYANTGQPEWTGRTSPTSEARGGWGIGGHPSTSTTAKKSVGVKGAIYITLNES